MDKQWQKEQAQTTYGKKDNRCLIFIAGLLGLGFTWAVPAMLATREDSLWYSNSLFPVFLWLMAAFCFYHICRQGFSGSYKKWVFPALFSFVFSLCMIFGAQLESKGSVAFANVGMWICSLVLTVCFTILVRFLWERIPAFAVKEVLYETGVKSENTNKDKGYGISNVLQTAAAIFVCYVPVFLAVYPGFFVYDAQDELLQVITRNFSTHHPLLHVLMLGGIIQLVYKITGSYNLGIACYTLFQMVVLSWVFAYAIHCLKKEGMPKWARNIAALYFGLFPTIVMFSLCSAKDGLFTGMVLIMTLMLRELFRSPADFWGKKTHVIFLIGSALMMCLLRHNGFYALVVFALLTAVTAKWTGLSCIWKKGLIAFAVVLAGYFLINSTMTILFSADDSENQELLTVPIMQMARVYAYEQDTLSEEDKQTLNEILPHDALMRYTPKVSDGVKIDFNNEVYSKNPSKYLKLWAKLGAEHPFAYLNAWFMTSYGFWYPDAVIDVYRGNSVFTFTYEDSSYFGFETEQPGLRKSRIPFLEEVYRRLSLELTQQRVPVLSMLFSPGFLFWTMMVILGKFAYERNFKKLFPYGFVFLLWLTVILGPTYLVRYVVFLWVLAPVLVWDLMRGDI